MSAFKYNSIGSYNKKRSKQLGARIQITALGDCRIKVLLYLHWLSIYGIIMIPKMIISCSDNAMSHIQREHEYLLYIFYKPRV